MTKVIPLRYDAVFKKAFSQVEVFGAFVKDVLGIELDIEKVERSYRYRKPVNLVDIEYDLLGEDSKTRTIVEIQHVKVMDFYDRFLYYFLIGIIEQVKSSRQYRIDKDVHTIVVLTSPKEIDFSVAMGGIELIDEFNRKVEIYSHRLAFLMPPLVNDETPESIRPWLELINDSLDEEIDETQYTRPVFQQVIDAIKEDNISPQELRQLIDENEWEATLRHEHQQGVEKGFQRGLDRGLEEGIEQGREETTQQIARSMLDKGIDIQTIAEVTGLRQQDIRALADASQKASNQ